MGGTSVKGARQRNIQRGLSSEEAAQRRRIHRSQCRGTLIRLAREADRTGAPRQALRVRRAQERHPRKELIQQRARGKSCTRKCPPTEENGQRTISRTKDDWQGCADSMHTGYIHTTHTDIIEIYTWFLSGEVPLQTEGHLEAGVASSISNSMIIYIKGIDGCSNRLIVIAMADTVAGELSGGNAPTAGVYKQGRRDELNGQTKDKHYGGMAVLLRADRRILQYVLDEFNNRKLVTQGAGETPPRTPWS